MGCGCGKKTIKPTMGGTVIKKVGGATGASAAKVFQSATLRKAPTGPLRKTV